MNLYFLKRFFNGHPNETEENKSDLLFEKPLKYSSLSSFLKAIFPEELSQEYMHLFNLLGRYEATVYSITCLHRDLEKLSDDLCKKWESHRFDEFVFQCCQNEVLKTKEEITKMKSLQTLSLEDYQALQTLCQYYEMQQNETERIRKIYENFDIQNFSSFLAFQRVSLKLEEFRIKLSKEIRFLKSNLQHIESLQEKGKDIHRIEIRDYHESFLDEYCMGVHVSSSLSKESLRLFVDMCIAVWESLEKQAYEILSLYQKREIRDYIGNQESIFRVYQHSKYVYFQLGDKDYALDYQEKIDLNMEEIVLKERFTYYAMSFLGPFFLTNFASPQICEWEIMNLAMKIVSEYLKTSTISQDNLDAYWNLYESRNRFHVAFPTFFKPQEFMYMLEAYCNMEEKKKHKFNTKYRFPKP